jgi:hypothetical protein
MHPVAIPPSSLEDRIRLLTDQAIAAKTQDELDAILPELKAAIRDHIRYLRAIAVRQFPRRSEHGAKQPNYRVGHRLSISFMISSAHRTASAIALIVAGTRVPPSY